MGRGGVGFLTRIRPGDVEDRRLAERIEPVLEQFQRENPELGNYRITDTYPNATLNSASPGPATLVEFGLWYIGKERMEQTLPLLLNSDNSREWYKRVL